MTLQEKINLLQGIRESVDFETFAESSGDSIEDLDEEEIDILLEQLEEKTKRPRHPIGSIA